MLNYGYNPYYSQYPNYYTNALQQSYANQQAQQQNQQNHYRVILVSNEEEAKATPADLNGNPTFFYNKSVNKIYLKQINPQTGAAPLQIFNAQPTAQDNIKTQPDELMNLSEQHYNTIIEGINGIYRMLAPISQQNIISTQPPIMEEPKQKGKSSAKHSD